MTDEIRDHYDQDAPLYIARRRSPYFDHITEMSMEPILDKLHGADALEVGCGPGNIMEISTQHGAQVTGVDLSPVMVEQARGRGLDAQVGDVTDLPFDDESFDIVYSLRVLSHVPDIETALDEIARVLRPTGIAHLQFYSRRSLRFMSVRMTQDVWTRHFHPSEVRELMSERFDVVGVRGLRTLAPFTYVYNWRATAWLFRWLDRILCDRWVASRFGGYLVSTGIKP